MMRSWNISANTSRSTLFATGGKNKHNITILNIKCTKWKRNTFQCGPKTPDEKFQFAQCSISSITLSGNNHNLSHWRLKVSMKLGSSNFFNFTQFKLFMTSTLIKYSRLHKYSICHRLSDWMYYIICGHWPMLFFLFILSLQIWLHDHCATGADSTLSVMLP